MKRKIIVVDDNKEFLAAIKDVLSLCSYEVIIVDDASLALEVIMKTGPDLILLDLKMPGKSGFQIAHELKDFKEINRVPIIAITGFLNDHYVSLMRICGIEHCLTKPFNPADIITLIESLLNKEKT